jgi:hypothetical protein
MKSLLKIVLLPAVLIPATLSINSCSKKFLDDKPYSSVVVGSAISTESDMLAAITSVYSAMRNSDLYGRSLPVKGDVMADNTFVITSNSGRYVQQNTYTLIRTDANAAGAWSAAYVAIKYANFVIENASKLAASATVNEYVGEAYAARALMHFELVRNFATPYTANAAAVGVPIILSFSRDTLPARSTVKQVYTQVIADLEKAYTLMTQYRGSAYLSKFAARALEARVYQNMGDWPNALTTSLDVSNNSGVALLDSAAYVAYWNNPVVQASSKNETLFEVASDVANNNGFDQIGYIYLVISGGGYGDILATPGLAGLYGAGDVRKNFCVKGTKSGQDGTAWFCYKYANPANTSDKDDTKVIRLSDVLLIAAEAYYNAGDYPNANLYLNKVAQKRDKTIAAFSNTGTQVLEDILTERRKELAFEGNRLWDLLRLQRSWTKVVNQSPLSTFAVTPTNTQLVYPIPKAELDVNPNMTPNPGY